MRKDRKIVEKLSDTDLITRIEMANIIGISLCKLRNLLVSNKTKPPKPVTISNKCYYYSKRHFEEWVNSYNLKEIKVPNVLKTYYPSAKKIEEFEISDFNRSALQFLALKPAIMPAIKPEKQPVKRKTVALKEMNMIETPCLSLEAIYRDSGGHNINASWFNDNKSFMI
jgi:hypothetical protein